MSATPQLAGRQRRPVRAILVAILAFLVGFGAITLLVHLAAALLLYGMLTGIPLAATALMGVAIVQPVAGLAGGLILALWSGWRSWRG